MAEGVVVNACYTETCMYNVAEKCTHGEGIVINSDWECESFDEKPEEDDEE